MIKKAFNSKNKKGVKKYKGPKKMPLEHIEPGKTKKGSLKYQGDKIQFTYIGSESGNIIQVHGSIDEYGNNRAIKNSKAQREIREKIRSMGYFGRILWKPRLKINEGRDLKVRFNGKKINFYRYNRGRGKRDIYVIGHVNEKVSSRSEGRLTHISDPKEQREVRRIIRDMGHDGKFWWAGVDKKK